MIRAKLENPSRSTSDASLTRSRSARCGTPNLRADLLNRSIPALSVVMPALDEEAGLDKVIADAVPALTSCCDVWELIVVDDASKDATARIVRDWSARDSRVRLMSFAEHQGYARAIAAGLSATRYETALYTDADGQFDLRDAPLLYDALDDVDLVVGYRRHRSDPLFRSVASFAYNRLQRLVTRADVRDVNCAFKMFTRRFLDRLRIESSGYMIDAEIFGRARQLGMGWREVGVTHLARERGATKIRWSTIPETLRGLWDLRRLLSERA